MHWAHPQAFLLLLALPAFFWPLWRNHRGITRLSSLSATWASTPSLGRWGPTILCSLRALAFVLLVITLARPQTPEGNAQRTSQGIAIQLVLDASLSMGYTDYSLNNHEISRMDAARHALRLFVRGDEKQDLSGRSQDLIGLVTFNRYPDVGCPLTHSHETLLSALEDVQLGPYTNIGDGLAWGLDRLRRSAPEQKILILLSDGKHNAPDSMDPVAAARLARDLGVRVYAIGAIGNQSTGKTSLSPFTSMARGLPRTADSVDEDSLQRVATMTGGKYFRATDTEGLLAIYKEIDQLEKSKIETTGHTRYWEWFPWVALSGLLALGLEQLLAVTRFFVLG